jgi:hypothetical protein
MRGDENEEMISVPKLRFIYSLYEETYFVL